LGYSVSGDLLFNLPGQTQADMQRDVTQALALGLDHLCLYHLVMFDGLGTEWSRDPALLAQLPSNPEACANWLALREFVLSNGYRQTTLTNFERSEVYSTDNRFLYEESVLSPGQNDWLGFGPSAISLFLDRDVDRALKLLNPESSAHYLQSLDGGSNAWSHYFSYSPRDVKILYLTRSIARLAIDRGEYAHLFQADPLSDFSLEFAPLLARGLLAISNGTIVVTPPGMFFADTAAGLLAWRQVKYQRCQQIIAGFAPQPEVTFYGRRANDASYHRMG
jgi:oxygen-independent coproporphyrinogen-3 oxidase